MHRIHSLKALLVITVVSAAACSLAVDIPAGDVDALLTAIQNRQQTIKLAAGVYDLTGKTPRSPHDIDATRPDYQEAYLLIDNIQTVMTGANSKHWSEKTPEEETVIKCDNATARIVYGYAGSGRSSIFKHITFEGGNATNGSGGAILFAGTEFAIPFQAGYASNCVFRNCTSASRGGATYDVHGYDCYYVDNTAVSGGAAYGDSANGDFRYTNDFIRCVFERNRATTGVGGALRLNHGGRVEDCTFIANTNANNTGGAVYINICGPHTQIRDCRFFDNEAHDSTGGAIYSANLLPVVADCVFSNNTAATSGALAPSAGIVSLTNCVFVGNTATGSGGGGGMKSSERVDHLVDCVFDGNTANGIGGAVFASSHSFGELRNCTFRNNRSNTESAGALWIGATQSNGIQNCTFIGNQAEKEAGALFINSAVTTMTNCHFISNTSVNNCASLRTGGFDLITGCSFVSNTTDNANYSGVHSASVDTAGKVENSLFDNNTNKFANVGSHIRFATEVTGCTFKGYGDLFSPKIDRCLFDGAVFHFNDYGGALINFNSTTGTGYVRNSLFTRCDIFTYIRNSTGASVEISNCTFVDNIARTVYDLGGKTMVDGYLLNAFRRGANMPSTNEIVNCVFWKNYKNERTEENRNDISVYVTLTSLDPNQPPANNISYSVYGSWHYIGNKEPIWGDGMIEGASNMNFAGESGTEFAALPYYSIVRRSPARNKGYNLDWMTASSLDLAGKPRVYDSIVDMGCYECDLIPTGTMLLFR